MDNNYAKILLDIQIENARRILFAGFGVNHAEAIFFDIIQLLRKNSNLKVHFLEGVENSFSKPDIGSLEEGMVPGDLIELVAHEFRWAELLNLAKLRVENKFSGNESLAAGDISQSIINAYDDNWPDREFYQYYK